MCGLPVADPSVEGGSDMTTNNLMSRLGGAVLGITLLLGIGMAAGTTAMAQNNGGWGGWNRDRDRDRDRDWDRDRDYRRDDRNRRGGYGGYQMARERGYEDGLRVGQQDAYDRKNFDPQRSHYYRSATDGYDGYYGNKDAYRQAFRDAFIRGYQDGY